LAYYGGNALPAPFRDGMFIGQHGSWNRSTLSGYKVIFIPFREGRPSGPPIDVLTGFLKQDTPTAHGRPVGVAVTHSGTLLVADDVGNTIWHVAAGGRDVPPPSRLQETTTGAGDPRK
jgi:glucose/arabinose dehydrogenase